MSEQLACDPRDEADVSLPTARADPVTLDLQHYTTPMLDHDAVWRIYLGDSLGHAVSRCPLAIGGGLGHATTIGAIGDVDVARLTSMREVDATTMTRFYAAAPSAVTVLLAMKGTPVRLGADYKISTFETVSQLAFDAIQASWLAVGERVDDVRDAVPRSEAFGAFSDLMQWLQRTAAETAALVGIGRTTPYAWQRDGREPQPASARRLYETHALVHQLALALGDDGARAALERGGEGSALALIAGNRVAEAEAELADLIYSRPAAGDVPLGASRAGDDDTDDTTPLPARQPGGRRRVLVRRGR